jgi:Ca2+/Na+ antiporter
MLLILQGSGADVFAEKIGEAIGAVVFFILIIMGIVWLVKKARK